MVVRERDQSGVHSVKNQGGAFKSTKQNQRSRKTGQKATISEKSSETLLARMKSDKCLFKSLRCVVSCVLLFSPR